MSLVPFVELTLQSGGPLWVRADQIACMWQASANGATAIKVGGGDSYEVMEAPQEILRMVSELNAAMEERITTIEEVLISLRNTLYDANGRLERGGFGDLDVATVERLVKDVLRALREI